MLNSKFVPSRPKGPAKSSQAHPKDTCGDARKVVCQAAQAGKGARGPRDKKPIPHATPNELSQDTVEKNMLRILHSTAHSTELGSRPISLTNLNSRNTECLFVESVGKKAVRRCQSSNSTGDKDRQKARFHPWEANSAIEIFRTEQ